MAPEDDPVASTEGGFSSLTIPHSHVSPQFSRSQVSVNYEPRQWSALTLSSNLSQARLGSLEKDLNMGGTDYNLATSILFVGYLLMQLPSNLLLTRIRPSRFLGIAMAIW